VLFRNLITNPPGVQSIGIRSIKLEPLNAERVQNSTFRGLSGGPDTSI
jgi:hypothetical protein